MLSVLSYRCIVDGLLFLTFRRVPSAPNPHARLAVVHDKTVLHVITTISHSTDVVQNDCQARKLNREDAMDRSRRREQIKMTDDQERSKWVNVSSGTGSPGLSRTKGRRMAVVVAIQHLHICLAFLFLSQLTSYATLTYPGSLLVAVPSEQA